MGGGDVKKDTENAEKITAKNPHEGHRERMRQRFVQTGFDGFSPHQIIEMLLFYAVPRADTNLIAHRLIDRFGSVAEVFDADISELREVKGVSENAAVLFKMIPASAAVYFGGKTEGVVYDNSDKLKELFRRSFIGCSDEEFRVACFNNDLTLAKIKTVAKGSPGSADVNIRAVAECIFDSRCTMAAFGHNHPKAAPAPSEEDIRFTRRVNQVLKELDVYLMDHIIVGQNSCFSMRENAAISIFD